MSLTMINGHYFIISHFFGELDRIPATEDGPYGRWVTVEDGKSLTALFDKERGRELHLLTPLSFAKLPVV